MAGIAAQARNESGQGRHVGSWRSSGRLRRSQLQSTSGQGPAGTGSGGGGWDTVAEEQQGGSGGVWGRLQRLLWSAGAADGPEARQRCQQADPASGPERAGREGLKATDIEMGAGVWGPDMLQSAGMGCIYVATTMPCMVHMDSPDSGSLPPEAAA